MYSEKDPDVIKLYAYELNWHMPVHLQQEAIDWLVEYADRDQLALVFPPYAKRCWQNAVKVVEKIGYPENIAAFPTMVELFQDLNWPGAEEAVLYFKTLEKDVVSSFIEVGGKQAIATNDIGWLWFLYAVCERLTIVREDFEDGTVFDAMKTQYEEA
ncbi:MAG: hypothetical protein ABS882_00465 [Lysinibacillus sp.]